jgi:hypothetical protein
MLGMQQMMQQMNMQNAQNIYQGLEHWGDICNCVPSRASLLTGDGS